MNTSKFGAICMSALLAMAVLVPASALAEPNLAAAEYGDGEGTGNTTALTLVAANPEDNLASNGGTEWVKQNAKVQVPVAINFVAKGDGTILGPSSGAYITNYSAFNVNVSRIKTANSNGATLVPEASCDAADEIYLSFKPGTNGTPIDLSAYKGQNGVATRPGEWDIAASTGDSGTSLELTGFTGKVGGFNSIDPTTKTAIGQIEWTIKAGSGQAVSLANTSVSTLQADSAAIRGGNTAVAALYEPSVGQTLSVTLGNGSSAQVRLVDVSSEKGLVFMFTAPIASEYMHTSLVQVSWNASTLRTSLNSGALYSSYLQGMTIGGSAVTPAKVTNNSLNNDGSTLSIVSTDVDNDGPADDGDMYWLPSVVEIYGAWPSNSEHNYSGDEGCTQFAYFGSVLSVTSSNYAAMKTFCSSPWWLRSNSPQQGDEYGPLRFAQVCGNGDNDGGVYFSTASYAVSSVIPCFAL